MMELRPHHALCLLLFEPSNHSESYIKIMYSMIEKLNGDPAREITLSAGLDTICGSCPHNESGTCAKEDSVRVITQNILGLAGISIGDTMTWDALRQKINDGIITCGRLSEACGSCSFFEQCKAMFLPVDAISGMNEAGMPSSSPVFLI